MIRKHKIVFLNGPPRSGKDEAGMALLKEREEVRLYAMKRPLDGALRGFFGADDRTWSEWEREKDTILDDTPFGEFGMTFRETKISFSEEWAKKKFGLSVFGRAAVNYLMRDQGHVRYAMTVITDSGFNHEAVPIMQTFGIKNCMLIHVHREGKTFDGDSRSHWVYAGALGELHTIDLHNNYELDFWHKQVNRAVAKWLGETDSA